MAVSSIPRRLESSIVPSIVRYTRSFVRITRLIIAAALLALCGCHTPPDWYPLPLQRNAGKAATTPVATVVSMESLRAEHHIVGGIVTTEAGASWRWTTERPVLRFQLNDNHDLRFVADFVVAEATFKQTGPVTLRFLIDGKEFARQRYDQPGEKHFEAKLDPALLPVEKSFQVAIDIQPFFLSPIDGAKLGILLIRMGFTP